MKYCLNKADFRKANVINLSKQFYQNLELITRVNNFPQLFHSEMIMNQFYNSKRKTSVFIGQKCYFYNNNITLIPQEQKLAISLEYLFFELIIPNLIVIAENLEQVLTQVKEEATLNLFGIASYMHKQFLSKFKSLQKLEFPNANMIFLDLIYKNQMMVESNQRQFKTKKLEMRIQLLKDQLISTLLFNQRQKNHFENIKWNNYLKKFV